MVLKFVIKATDLSSSRGDKSYKPNPKLARVFNILFILYVEYEMSSSMLEARHFASSGIDVYTDFAKAIGTLYGPLHNAANEGLYDAIQSAFTFWRRSRFSWERLETEQK